MQGESRRFRFSRKQRLSRDRDFQQVLSRGCRKPRGPLMFYVLPNELGYSRLGLSVGKKVGNAVRRNRVKRMLRESFRLLQHELPVGYDIVAAARRHEELTLSQYQEMMRTALAAGDREWQRRAKRKSSETESDISIVEGGHA